ncbi:MAG TPA: PhzF family phenazine biosynthesis protein [Casimicrobiaceae bacterium]
MYAFRLVNVFAEDASLTGNPLAVFEDARGLDAETMQALALQFNLSETTFLLPSSRASVQVRIFTPTFEMPFAGHPTLGSAHVARDTLGLGDDLRLEMHAGIIPVCAAGDVWTLTANVPRWHAPEASGAALAAMLGLADHDLATGQTPLWVDTGSEQLVIPLANFDAVRRAKPVVAAMQALATRNGRTLAYVFAREGSRVLARFFFSKHGAVVEDPGTGSACANLGGWLVATGAALPQSLVIEQGEAVGRRCRLGLEVGRDRAIRVSGRVVEIGRGTVSL